jgi:hypothetical protein
MAQVLKNLITVLKKQNKFIVGQRIEIPTTEASMQDSRKMK